MDLTSKKCEIDKMLLFFWFFLDLRTRKHKTDLEQVSLKPIEEEKTPCRSKRGENLSLLNGGTGITTEASHDRKKSKKRKDKNPVEVDEQEVQPKKKRCA